MSSENMLEFIMSKKVSDFLKMQREKRGLSFREASKLSGISHSYIRSIEKGLYFPTFDKVIRLLEAYKVDIRDFLCYTGYLPANVTVLEKKELKKVPIFKIAELKNSIDIALAQEREGGSYIETQLGGNNLFALEVEESSMAPEFSVGDIVIIDPERQAISGDFVLVKVDGGVLLRQLRVYKSSYVFRALDVNISEIEVKKTEKGLILGKVIEKRKKYE